MIFDQNAASDADAPMISSDDAASIFPGDAGPATLEEDIPAAQSF